MTMLAEYTFTEARSNLTELVDKAQRFMPTVIKPRKKSEEATIMVSVGFILLLLDSSSQVSTFKPEFYEEEDGSLTICLEPFDIVVNGPTKKRAIDKAVEETIDYALEYLSPEKFYLYSKAPNRRSHLPLVTKIALCNSPDQVKELIRLA